MFHAMKGDTSLLEKFQQDMIDMERRRNLMYHRGDVLSVKRGKGYSNFLVTENFAPNCWLCFNMAGTGKTRYKIFADQIERKIGQMPQHEWLVQVPGELGITEDVIKAVIDEQLATTKPQPHEGYEQRRDWTAENYVKASFAINQSQSKGLRTWFETALVDERCRTWERFSGERII